MDTTKKDQMKRGEFLRSLGLSTSTLMAFYCLGTTMTACGSKDEDPDPNPNPNPGGSTGVTGTTTGSNINFTVDLANSANADIKGTPKFKIIGDVIVAQASGGTFVALSKTCTHEGGTLAFRTAQNDFLCPNHLSEFSTTGAVQQGPATTPVKTYTVTVSSDGNTLTVKA
jgi:cytochrome b6-f complex iron-sulfur subunit